MKAEFIWNYEKTSVVNVSHIVKMSITAPVLEQKDWRVVASLPYGQGTVVLHRGDEESCNAFLSDFYYFH